MKRKTNIEDVETALNEAAVVATFGSREQRSGRFSPAQSSAIDDINYDEDNATLDVTFTGGKTYRYRNVPLEIYVELMEAESKGAFFNRKIKPAFEFVEVNKRSRD